jgi:hypothetical protein
MQMIEEAQFDGVLLDVELQGESVDEVAAMLAGRNKPFAFVTGLTREDRPAAFRDAPDARETLHRRRPAYHGRATLRSTYRPGAVTALDRAFSHDQDPTRNMAPTYLSRETILPRGGDRLSPRLGQVASYRIGS